MQLRAYSLYVARRFAAFLLTILGSFTLAFFFFRLIPGNPLGALLVTLQQQYSYTSADAANYVNSYREAFGLDLPLYAQYFRYIGNVLFRFDLGPSLLAFPTPAQALPWTIGLLGLTVILSWFIGLILGGVLGWRRNTRWSQFFTTVAVGFSQIPQYIVAILLVFLLAYTLNWLPSRDAYAAGVTPGFNWPFIGSVVRHGLIPGLAMVIVSLAGWIISTRSLMVLILGEDYLLYAQAKGLSERRIFTHYALRNTLLPQVTGLAISLGFIINGALLVETLFNYPGIGSLLARAVGVLDYNTIQGIVLISIVSVLAANFLLDILLPLLDPRIRAGV